MIRGPGWSQPRGWRRHSLRKRESRRRGPGSQGGALACRQRFGAARHSSEELFRWPLGEGRHHPNKWHQWCGGLRETGWEEGDSKRDDAALSKRKEDTAPWLQGCGNGESVLRSKMWQHVCVPTGMTQQKTINPWGEEKFKKGYKFFRWLEELRELL